MDNFEQIALSRIASVLDKHKLIKPDSNAVWNKILSNAGQSALYTQYSNYLEPYWYKDNWKNPNQRFENFYTGIISILKKVYSNGQNLEEFSLLLSSIIEGIHIFNIFDEHIEVILPRGYRYGDPMAYFKESEEDDINLLITLKASDDFNLLKNNLNIFNFDISYSKNKSGLILSVFTGQSSGVDRNPATLISWLQNKFPNIGAIYKEGINNYISGEAVSCISNCRNIITGIFSEYKNDGNRNWIAGLQKISPDKNIENVTPNNIPQGTANNKITFENGGQFKYPRFMTVYQLYSLISDLGSHSTEAPKVNGRLYPEETTLNDALLCLRMTEDVLIWVKERLKTIEE